MRTFQVAIEVGNIAGDRSDMIEALVDTGASNSIFPASFLRSLGIEPTGRKNFRFADERLREFEVGMARLRMYGEERVEMIVFGDDSMSPLIGAMTLEHFWLAVDPTGRRLMEVPGLLMTLDSEA